MALVNCEQTTGDNIGISLDTFKLAIGAGKAGDNIVLIGLLWLIMNYYERVNRPRAGKAVIFMPGSFCWCTLDLLVWKLTCWALIYGKQILFLIFPGHIPPFKSWAGQSIQHETQNSHLKALFLCLSLYVHLPTHLFNSLYFCLPEHSYLDKALRQFWSDLCFLYFSAWQFFQLVLVKSWSLTESRSRAQ